MIVLVAKSVAKEMGLTHADFFRTISSALATDNYQSSELGVVYKNGHRRLEIILGPESNRRIARLSIPSTDVTMSFSGYTDDEITEFVARFDRVFRRGGG